MAKLVVEARGFWALLLAVAAAFPAAHGMWLNLPSTGRKCVYEELQSNVVVMADYHSFYGDADANYTVHPSLNVEVLSPLGKNLHHKEGATHGQFAFTANEPGAYWACFMLGNHDQTGKTVTVGLDWKIGIATKDWDSVARKEKIEGLDLELQKLQSYVQTIKDKMIHMMSRELEMKAVSVRTNARVANYSQASLSVCILVSALQLWYLKRYFHKKKLI